MFSPATMGLPGSQLGDGVSSYLCFASDPLPESSHWGTLMIELPDFTHFHSHGVVYYIFFLLCPIYLFNPQHKNKSKNMGSFWGRNSGLCVCKISTLPNGAISPAPILCLRAAWVRLGQWLPILGRTGWLLGAWLVALTNFTWDPHTDVKWMDNLRSPISNIPVMN